MGIARAIERVKRQARQGGLQAVMAGLGEELRSPQIPAPLRSTAHRIASLLEGGKSGGPAATGSRAAQVSTGGDTPAPNGRGMEQAVVPTGTASNTNAVPAPADVARVAAMSVGSAPRGPGSGGASHTGSDVGDEPGPEEPAASTPVDAEAVGATPEVNASPIEVEPVDASPVDASAVDATPVDVDPQLAASEAAAKPKHRPPRQPTGDPSPTDGNSKEELAPTGEAAKNLARSGRGAKKRAGSARGNTSKKK